MENTAALHNLIHSLKAHTQIVDGQPVGFKSREKGVLIALYNCQRLGIRTSRKSISEYSLASVASIGKSLNVLAKLGYVAKCRHVDAESGGNLSNTYTINASAIAAAVGR
ncbi:MAG: hypothetical protein V4555_00750 [Acidobacteriota bacterium]